MTLEDVYMIGQTIAAIGVVGSLLFVGLQVMDNSRAVRTTAAQAVHDSFAGWYQTLVQDPAIVSACIRGMAAYDSLGAEEKATFTCVYTAYFAHAQNAFYQWKSGALAPHLWRVWQGLLVNFINTPGGEQFWSERQYYFGDAFQAHVREARSAPLPPNAKGLGVVPLRARAEAADEATSPAP